MNVILVINKKLMYVNAIFVINKKFFTFDIKRKIFLVAFYILFSNFQFFYFSLKCSTT